VSAGRVAERASVDDIVDERVVAVQEESNKVEAVDTDENATADPAVVLVMLDEFNREEPAGTDLDDVDDTAVTYVALKESKKVEVADNNEDCAVDIVVASVVVTLVTCDGPVVAEILSIEVPHVTAVETPTSKLTANAGLPSH
jgi:hypothetical protein